jgi:hypothetical protein
VALLFEAFIVAQLPAHTPDEEGSGAAVGVWTTVMETTAVLVQPSVLEPVTV